MIIGAIGTAEISSDGTIRWTLTRTWDARPVLLVVMFNPSTAGPEVDDNTVNLVCQIASHNGYGGIMVVNGIPLRSSVPAPAIQMLEWDKASDWSARDLLLQNIGVIQREAGRAGAVLLAWGALAHKTNSSADWFDNVREEIECAVKDGTPIYCLGKTKAGCPIHPMARGKMKVSPTAKLIPWSLQ